MEKVSFIFNFNYNDNFVVYGTNELYDAKIDIVLYRNRSNRKSNTLICENEHDVLESYLYRSRLYNRGKWERRKCSTV